jgi:hypothetical protein
MRWVCRRAGTGHDSTCISDFQTKMSVLLMFANSSREGPQK